MHIPQSSNFFTIEGRHARRDASNQTLSVSYTGWLSNCRSLVLENLVLITVDTNIITAFNPNVKTCYHYHYPIGKVKKIK